MSISGRGDVRGRIYRDDRFHSEVARQRAWLSKVVRTYSAPWRHVVVRERERQCSWECSSIAKVGRDAPEITEMQPGFGRGEHTRILLKSSSTASSKPVEEVDLIEKESPLELGQRKNVFGHSLVGSGLRLSLGLAAEFLLFSIPLRFHGR